MAGDDVTAVVMVGGFGQSRYLKSKARDAIAAGTQVVQPENGWSAVVKGAVIHGLSQYGPSAATVDVASRVARRSYGTCLLAKYDMMRHDPREAYEIFCSSNVPTGQSVTDNAVQILVGKGGRDGCRGDVVVHPQSKSPDSFHAPNIIHVFLTTYQRESHIPRTGRPRSSTNATFRCPVMGSSLRQRLRSSVTMRRDLLDTSTRRPIVSPRWP